MPILGITASAQQASKLSSFYSIATVTATGGETSLTFSSIPSTYTHLQIRGIARDTTTGQTVANSPTIYINGDSGANYAYHYFYGNGSSAVAASASSQSKISLWGTSSASSATSGMFGVSITDIYDYASTSKYKTTRSIGGTDINATGGYVSLNSGLWLSTSAITSITLLPVTGFAAGTTFALYGVK